MHDLRREGIRGRRLPFFVVTAVIVFAGWIYAVGDPATRQSRVVLYHKYGALPLSFEENRGQTDARVKFLARGSGYALFLTPTEAVLKLRAASPSTRRKMPNHSPAGFSSVRIRLKDANPAPKIAGIDRLAGTSNYFIGRDPKQWHTNIPTFGGVRFGEIYPGVNLVYRGAQGLLEYDLEVSPNADPTRIKLAIEGARKLAIDASRDLVISTAAGNVIQHAPLIYQTVAGQKRVVPGGYVLEGARTVAFTVGAYDTSRPLIIDPLLTYASYLGGTGGDLGVSIAVDQSDGSAWVTGTTTSTDFPATPLGFQQTNFGNSDTRSARTAAACSIRPTPEDTTSIRQAASRSIPPAMPMLPGSRNPPIFR
jgi:hypothetical protein